MKRVFAIGLMAGAATLLGSCASGRLSYDELPNRPVALVVRSEDDAKRLQETVQHEAEERAETRDKLPSNDPMDRARELYENMIQMEKNRARFSKLMFLDPIERETERVEFATPGARPLAWTYDRARLLFQTERQRRPQLFEWIEATGEVRQVTFGRPHVDGTYGPDGRVAIVRRSALRQEGDRIVGGFQVFVADPGGANPRRVTDGPFDLAPTWSPDGKTLVYEHWDQDGIDTLRRLDPDEASSGRIVLSRPLARGRAPVFTPDGEWVIYSARTRSGYRLAKMHPDGTGRRSLGQGALQEFDPSVSPGGEFVIYVGHNPSSESGPQILVKRIEGSNPRQISIDGFGLLPVW